MHKYIMRASVAAVTGMALSTVGVTGASASAAAPQMLGLSSGGTSHATASPGTQLWAKLYGPSSGPNQFNKEAVSPNGSTVYVTGENAAGAYATVAYNAATGAQRWAKLYKGGGARAVAVSRNGSTVYVTGEVSTISSGTDYATVAYNAATGAQRWAKRYNGPGNNNDYANSLAVSPNDKTVFVTGESDSASFVAQYATVAYNAATGARLWVKRYNGPGSSTDIAHSVAVSPTGSTVFVTGTSTGVTSTDDATIAYNAATGAQRWAKRYNGPAISTATATSNSVVVSPTGGTVYVTGTTARQPLGGGYYATVAYNAATGAQLWAKRYTSDGGADSVAVNPSGRTVYVTGDIFTVATGFEYATIAYNAATGAQRWVEHHHGTFGDAYAFSVAVSPSGGMVYVTGSSLPPGGSSYDYATIAYNAATGAQLWAKLYNGPGNGDDFAFSVAVSPTSGTVFVTGQAVGSKGYDYATIAYKG